MTPKEIILANIEHHPVPRCGMTFDRGRINDMVSCGCGKPEGYQPKRWYEGPYEYYDDEYGNIWIRQSTGPVKGEIFQPALDDWSKLKNFSFPSYNSPQLIQSIRQQFIGKEDYFKVVWLGGWIFNDARYLRKLETYLMDMALYPEELQYLHQALASIYKTKIIIAGNAGADGIAFAEDMGTQKGLLFSPTMWRFYFKQLYSELFQLAHELGMKVLMHSCGYNWAILGDLLEAGVDVFQFDQPMIYNLSELAQLFDQYQAALWSPLDIQRVLPTGNREYIQKSAQEMCRLFQGKLICKNYPDLPGIGVQEEWDQWGYEAICQFFQIF